VWLFGTIILAMGILQGIDPIISQGHGARHTHRVATALQQGWVLAALMSLPVAGAWLATRPALLLLGQDPELAEMARRYVWIQIPSIPFFLWYFVLRQYLVGRTIMRPAMWVALIANLVNVALNWVFIFGHLGAPALGLFGAGLASGITRGFMFVALLALVFRARHFEGGWVPWSRKAYSGAGMREILHFGLPVGVQLGLEIWAFEIAMLLSGRLGTKELDANVIVLNLASIAFMVPLGISMAATTRVGNLIGEGRPRRAQTAAWISLAMGASVMTLSAVAFVTCRHLLPRIYTDDGTVIGLAAGILPIAAAFQVFDGTQVVGTGVLRGMGRTRPSAAMNLIGYYGLALPLAWWMAFPLGWGLPGLWWGLCLGLASVALMLTLWIGKRGPARIDARVVAAPSPEPISVPSPESPAGP
jgi:MATE family multidrug resistance protein